MKNLLTPLLLAAPFALPAYAAAPVRTTST
jgi:hypothetical protein